MNKTDELRTARIESLVTPAELAQRHPGDGRRGCPRLGLPPPN